jgi:FKBP-type peptidyl-prolyl cis-trans isomerase 2
VINNTTGKAEPSVTLIDNAGDEIYGAVEYTNATTITVDFNSNIAGSSILN